MASTKLFKMTGSTSSHVLPGKLIVTIVSFVPIFGSEWCCSVGGENCRAKRQLCLPGQLKTESSWGQLIYKDRTLNSVCSFNRFWEELNSLFDQDWSLLT